MTKNAIDWLSRPPSDIARVFRGKPVAIAGASPGGFGTYSPRAPGCPFSARSARILRRAYNFSISRASDVIDANGEITDAATRESIGKFIAGFVAHLRERAHA